MSSPIRSLLSNAQAAEIRGDKQEAAKLLREAAEFYSKNNMRPRALQMQRHAMRLEGHPEPGSPLEGFEPRHVRAHDDVADDEELGGPMGEVDLSDDFGFGDELLGDERQAVSARSKREAFQREIRAVEQSADAWCSFCCRPQSEVGGVVEGPTGSFICRNCLATGQSLLSVDAQPVVSNVVVSNVVAMPVRAPPELLEGQRAALELWNRHQPRCTLVFGTAGVGKTKWLSAIGQITAHGAAPSGKVALIDVTEAVALEAAFAQLLLSWHEQHASRQVVFAIRGRVEATGMTLKGANGDVTVYDTESLRRAVSQRLPDQFVERTDLVLHLPSLTNDSLRVIAERVLKSRSVELSEARIAELISVAERSGRGAHELVALISRIPPGRYE